MVKCNCEQSNRLEFVEVLMNRKVRLLAIIVFAIALIVSIIRVFIDFNYGMDKTGLLIPTLDIVSVIVWAICIVVNCIQYRKKDK